MRNTPIRMKFSANIPNELLLFLYGLVKEGHYKSRSQALTEALHSWRNHKLEADYAKAFDEPGVEWDVTVSDGFHEDGVQ